MTRTPTRLALAGGLLALLSGPLIAAAQDGDRPTQGPVTDPKTNDTIPRPATSTPPVRDTSEILPPVPASELSPAPPGTRAVPVEQLPGEDVDPATRPRAAVPAAPGQAIPGRQARGAVAGVRTVEGVVVAIERPEGSEAGPQANEKVRLIIDPTREWIDFASAGPRNDPQGPAGAGDEQAEATDRPLVDAAARAAAASREELKDDEAPADPADRPDAPPAVEGEHTIPVVITAGTRVYAHARTADGVDMHGLPTASSPRAVRRGVGVTGRVPQGEVNREMETNFTNIHVGSFVSVRYREVGDALQAVNVNLVELPLDAPDPAAGTAPAAGAAPVPADPAAGVPPVDAIPREGGQPPVRVPVVPGRPVPPGNPG